MPEPNNGAYQPGQDQQGNVISPNENVVYTRKSIGYADGYSQYKQKTGAHSVDGTTIVETITKSNDPSEHEKYVSPKLLIDNQSNEFRRINGYGSDAYEDPTFLIFDLKIKRDESPLFREDMIKAFITAYSPNVPELLERTGYWEEFIKIFFKIFPSDNTGDESGIKRHYIEAISGLDVLLNPIINYPEDIITFSLTEDVTMTLQYLAELYNNLIYSYDSHRYLIPDNLLRFNMEITIRDIRNMKIPGYYNNQIEDNINTSISKFIYVLHDCQFNFMKTKNFTAEIRRGGFGAAPVQYSAGGTVDINFKSYSKITAPLLIDNSKIIDFRERETKSLSDAMKVKVYQTDALTNDYKSQTEVKALEKSNAASRDIQYKSRAANNPALGPPFGLQLPEINTNIRGFANLVGREIIEVRDVIIQQVYSEVNQLITAGERIIGNKLGFTIGKTNVYYYSLQEKAVTRFAFMFEDLLRGESNVIHGAVKDLGRVWSNKDLQKEQQKDMSSSIWNQTTQDLKNTAIDRLSQYYNPNYTFVKPLNQPNVYDGTTVDKLYPSGKIDLSSTGHTDKPMGKIDITNEHIIHPLSSKTVDISSTGHTIHPLSNKLIDLSSTPHPDESTNRIYPDGRYNQKFPSGVVESGGTYNQKFPDGVVEPTGTYNQKLPSGVVESGSTYNQKFPNGIVEPAGTYNQKFPNGTVEPAGTYNQKFPSGDLNPDGKYNQKFPSGVVEPKGGYNQKFPSGDLNPDGTYNQKFPDGSVEPAGTYNEKYPKGSVEPAGTYNEKYPKGDLNPDGTYNQKFPDGTVEPKGKPNNKFPDGSVEDKGKYNEKFPSGRVESEGKLNDKYPSGTVESESTYNQKFPDGSVEPEGKPNDKFPKGSVEDKGKYNDKPPVGNIYGKNKPLPPTLKLGNVYKNK